MSKIGRKPIDVSNVNVEVKGQEVHYKGPKGSGVYYVPEQFEITLKDKQLLLTPRIEGVRNLKKRDINREWGMHWALLANELAGAQKEFEKNIDIIGLGYKAVKAGDKLVFTLGFSHKIDFPLPQGVSVSLDKTGQKLKLSSSNKELLGLIGSKMCDLRPPEPYKGTGVRLTTDHILRKKSKGK